MTTRNDQDHSPATPGQGQATSPGLATWHAGVAAGIALLALAGAMLGELSGFGLFGVLAMLAPALAGLLLLAHDDRRARSLLLGGWMLAALVAAMLSGGLSGPMAGLAALPFCVGLAIGGTRAPVWGAVGWAAAALAGYTVSLFAPAATPPLSAALSVVLAAGSGVLALRLSWRARERRLEALEIENKRLEALLGAQPGLTLVMQPTGRILAAYGRAPRSLTPDRLFESGLVAAVHAPDRPGVLSAIEAAMQGRREAVVAFSPRAAMDRRIGLILRRLDDPTGEPRLIATAYDDTAQYVRELGLETARAEAEAQNAGKSRFLANMSHELRTPLNAVLGFADMMRQRIFGPLPDRYADYADSIHQAGGHLLDLINDVLDVSKIEADRYQLSMERFDMREVVSAAVALVRVSAEEKGVELTPVMPGDELTVTADRRALKQIALNLLSNAVKFTPARGSITVSLEGVGPYAELVVSDTGVGIAPEDLGRLGRPFEQAGGVDQRAQGTGLGLSLVRALSELHGGRMNIDSTLGEGTAVTVRLPIIASTRAPAPEGGAEIIPFSAANDAGS